MHYALYQNLQFYQLTLDYETTPQSNIHYTVWNILDIKLFHWNAAVYGIKSLDNVLPITWQMTFFW